MKLGSVKSCLRNSLREHVQKSVTWLEVEAYEEEDLPRAACFQSAASPLPVSLWTSGEDTIFPFQASADALWVAGLCLLDRHDETIKIAFSQLQAFVPNRDEMAIKLQACSPLERTSCWSLRDRARLRAQPSYISELFELFQVYSHVTRPSKGPKMIVQCRFQDVVLNLKLNQWFDEWHSQILHLLSDHIIDPSGIKCTVRCLPSYDTRGRYPVIEVHVELPWESCRPCSYAQDSDPNPRLAALTRDQSPDHIPRQPTVPLHLQPDWVQTLAGFLNELGVTRHGEDDPRIKIRTWYLCPDRYPVWHVYRTLELNGMIDFWLEDLHRLWRDVLEESPVTFHVVHDELLADPGEQDCVADVILTQRVNQDWSAVLLATRFLDWHSRVYTSARLIPQHVNKWTLIYLQEVDRHCGGPGWLVDFHRLCQVFKNYRRVGAEILVSVSGDAFLIEIHPPVYMPRTIEIVPDHAPVVSSDSEDGPDDEVTLLTTNHCKDHRRDDDSRPTKDVPGSSSSFWNTFSASLLNESKLRHEGITARLEDLEGIADCSQRVWPSWAPALRSSLIAHSKEGQDPECEVLAQVWFINAEHEKVCFQPRNVVLGGDCCLWETSLIHAWRDCVDAAQPCSFCEITVSTLSPTFCQYDATILLYQHGQTQCPVLLTCLLQEERLCTMYQIATFLPWCSSRGDVFGCFPFIPLSQHPDMQVRVGQQELPESLYSEISPSDSILMIPVSFDAQKFEHRQLWALIHKQHLQFPSEPHDPSPTSLQLVQTDVSVIPSPKRHRGDVGDPPWEQPPPQEPFDDVAAGSSGSHSPPAGPDEHPSDPSQGEGADRSPSEPEPDDDFPGAPPANVPASKQNVLLLRMLHDSIWAVVSWDQYEQMMWEIAAHYSQSPRALLATHELALRLPDAPDGVTALIVQFIHDLPPGSDYKLCVVDLEIHESVHQVAFPTWKRMVVPLPPRLSRILLLRILRVQVYCQVERDRCLVHHDLNLWNLQDLSYRRIQHGMYFRVTVPPSHLTSERTSCLLATREQGIPDDGMDPLMARILGIPADTEESNPEEEDHTAHMQFSATMASPAPGKTRQTQAFLTRELEDIFARQIPDIPRHFLVMTWFADDQGAFDTPRQLWINDDSHRWLEQLAFLWRDRVQDDAQLWYGPAMPQPWEQSEPLITHVLVWQNLSVDNKVILSSVYDSLFDGGHPVRYASVVSEQTTTEALLQEVGLAGRCTTPERVEYSVWWGTIELVAGARIHICPAYAFNFVAQHFEDAPEDREAQSDSVPLESTRMPLSAPSLPSCPGSEDEVSTPSGLFLSHVVPHDVELDEQADFEDPSPTQIVSLMQTSLGASTPADDMDPPQDPCSPSSEPDDCVRNLGAPNLDSDPVFLWSLYQKCGSVDGCSMISTWFLDFRSSRKCHAPRMLSLSPRWTEWRDQITSAWNDRLNDQKEVSLFLVHPDVPSVSDPVCAHVIVAQNAILHEKAVLATIHDKRAASPAMSQLALVQSFAMVPETLMLGAGVFSDCFLTDIPTRCEVWIGDALLPWNMAYYPNDGQSVELVVGTTGVDEVMSEDSEDPLHLLQMVAHRLQVARKPNDFAHAPFCPKASGLVEGMPVRISLETTLPVEPTPLEPSMAMFQLLDKDWQTCLRRPWIDALARLPPGLDIPPSTWEALHETPTHAGAPAIWLELYVDGSFSGEGAGWSVVVVMASAQGRSFLGCLAGPVQTHSDQHDWLGATYASNITAEFSAAIVALAYGLTQSDKMVYIRPDLLLTKKLLEFECATQCNQTMGQFMAALSSQYPSGAQVWEVRAHQDDPWNELADRLAKWAATQGTTCGTVPWNTLRSIVDSPVDCHWMWLQTAPWHLRQAFPPLHEGQVWQPPPIPIAHEPQLDLPQETATEMVLHFSIASFNVLALGAEDNGGQRGQRALRLSQQFNAKQLALVGLQETRTASGQFVTDDYRILSSGCQHTDRAPHFGCELWIHKRLTIATHGEQRVQVAHLKPVVVEADPRFLLVTFSGAINFVVAVAHAPCVSSTSSADVVSQWWSSFARRIRQVQGHGPVVVLVDANAPLASEESSMFGLHGAEPMNPQGYMFQQSLVDLQLAVPATLGFHEGPCFTWTHPRGPKLRRDYVVVDHEWLSMVQRTSTWTDIDGGFQHEDHLPSLCTFHGFLEVNREFRSPRWDRNKFKDPACVHSFQQALASLPVPTWSIPVDDHAAQVEDQILRIAHQSFAQTTPSKPLRPVLSESTLSLVALKRQVLNWMRSSPPELAADLKLQIQDIEKDLRPRVRADQRKWYDAWLADVQTSADQHDNRRLFRMLVRLGRKKGGQPKGPRPLPRLVGSDGQPAHTIAECQETWRQHFAQIEAGLHVSVEELQKVHDSLPTRELDQLDLHMIPSLWEVQSAMSRVKAGKSPGPNALLPEFFKIGGLPLALHLHALTTKAAVSVKEPLKWKGGNLIPLYKGKGVTSCPANFRAIFVSNISAKLYHSCIRNRLEAIWLRNLDSLQQGGRKKFGTDLSHHLLQAFHSWGRHAGVSTAVLFVDLHSAFYSVLRASLFEQQMDVSLLRKALAIFQIEPVDMAEVLEVTAEDHALLGLSAHGQNLLMDFFAGAFFQMHSTHGVTLTTRGTRPGDPLGDLLFNLVFQVVMRQARETFLQRTGLPWLGAPTSPLDFSSIPGLPASFHFQLAFVDDLACSVAVPDNTQLMSILASMTSSLHEAARQRGLKLNYTQGKTEGMVSVHGQGARKLRQLIWRQHQGVWPILVEHEVLSLRIVKAYKHLGTFLQDGAVTTKDRGVRLAGAKQAFGTLSRSFFSKRLISLPSRAQVFASLVVSRHVYNVHTWSWLTPNEIQLWSTGLRSQVAVLAKSQLKGLPLHMFTTDELYSLVGLATPADMLHAHRLRFFARSVAHAPLLVWQLLVACHSPHSWLTALQSSFHWLQEFSPKYRWPDPYDLPAWILTVQVAKRWKGSVKTAAFSALQYKMQRVKAKVWEKDVERTLQRNGGLAPELCVPLVDPVMRTWQCGFCDQAFATRRGLAMHCSKLHGYRPWAKYYMQDSVCLACGVDFVTRPRALLHLSAQFACAATYKACFPPIADEEVLRLDEEDRQLALLMAGQGWGRTKALQPAMRIPLPLLPCQHDVEAQIMRRYWAQRLPSEGQGFHNFFGWCTQPDDADNERNEHVAGDLIIPYVGNSLHGSQEGHLHVYHAAGLSLSTVRVFLTARVFVHFYSGHRRHGDLQWMIENQWWCEDVVCFCLSIDLCLEKQCSDMARQENVKFWQERMLAGQILGIGGGPSCETWTAARLLEGGPRPVRDHADPWGKPALTKAEWAQVSLGTTLLKVLVDFLLLAARLGLCGFLEHPAYPTWSMRMRPCSVWALRIFRMLSRLHCVGITTFDQCTLGLAARKPTTMLLLRLPETRRFLLAHGHQGRCCHSQGHPKLQGRTDAGEFRTSVAKIYPPGLNEALARGILHFAKETSDPEHVSAESLPVEFLPLMSHDLVDKTIVQPDYHGR